MTGKTPGRYRLGEQLDHGGMGEVYLADNVSLDRKVALKFHPDALPPGYFVMYSIHHRSNI